MYRHVSGLFTAIIPDQSGSLNGFANEHCELCNPAVMKWKRKKRAICFSFLIFSLFSFPLLILTL